MPALPPITPITKATVRKTSVLKLRCPPDRDPQAVTGATDVHRCYLSGRTRLTKSWITNSHPAWLFLQHCWWQAGHVFFLSVDRDTYVFCFLEYNASFLGDINKQLNLNTMYCPSSWHRGELVQEGQGWCHYLNFCSFQLSLCTIASIVARAAALALQIQLNVMCKIFGLSKNFGFIWTNQSINRLFIQCMQIHEYVTIETETSCSTRL